MLLAQLSVRLLCLVALWTTCNAHAGHFHDYPVGDPVSKNLIRQAMANCSTWVTPQSNSSITVEAVDPWSVTGPATLWSYLKANCSEEYTAAIAMDVVVFNNGQPAANTALDGFVVTGTCSSGVNVPYLLNVSDGLVDENMVFFHNHATNSSGELHGVAANDGNLIVGGANGANAFVLYSGGVAISCCDFSLSGQNSAEETFLGEGLDCSTDSNNTSTPGMCYDGMWMACSEKINGTYMMFHDTWIVCDIYKPTNATEDPTCPGGAMPTPPPASPRPNSAMSPKVAYALFASLLAAIILRA